MTEKRMCSKFKNFSLSTTVFALLFGMGACSKNEVPDKPTPKVEGPTHLSECVESDVAGLRTLAQANPDLSLFQGDNPSQWTTVKVEWIKDKAGKYAVRALLADEKSKTDKALTLLLDGRKNGNVVFNHLQEINIAAPVKEITILSQPALTTVRIDGTGQASAERVNIQGDEALKNVSIENLPRLTDILLGGDDLQTVTLANLPRLQDQSKLRFRAGYDDEGNEVKDTFVKELTLKGDLGQLNGLYLQGLNLEKLHLQTQLPLVTALTLNGNRLSGVLELKGLPGITMLNVAKNQLEGIKISECPQLNELNASANPLLKQCELNLPALRTLDLNETALTAIDLGQLPLLRKISAYKSQLASVVFSSQNQKLSSVNLSENQLTQLSFPKEASGIALLTLSKNVLTSLNVSMLTDLERLLVKENKLESLTVEASQESFEELECENNHLSAKQLREVKERLSELTSWSIAPQRLLGRVDVDKKQIRATEEIDDLRLELTVQKKVDKRWTDADAGDYRLDNGVYTIQGTGTFRVIYTGSILDGSMWRFNKFTAFAPYIVGEVSR